MPRFDSVLDEPEDRKPSKTDTKTKFNPFSHLDDLDAFDITGKAPAKVNPEPKGSDSKKSSADVPNMPKASADSTRAKTRNIASGDQMRDFMGRVQYDQGDEISDAEAARRAGSDTDNRLPTHTTRQNLPAVLGSNLVAAGMQHPEWHTINNLPGYLSKQIRGMGRQFFRMFTNTPLESIMTIANVNGRGPNTTAEINAVGAWLQRNGEDMGDIEVDMGPAIVDYRPEVKEYRAAGIRFHVVRDPMGQYIYAYPEQDAVQHGGRLGAPEPGNMPRLPNRESIMTNKNAILEGIFNSDLSRVQLEETASIQSWTNQIISEMMLAEKGSTLSRLIGDSPGGQNLVNWLHKKDRLSASAAWSEVTPETGRVQWMGFKSGADHFLVVQGRTAVVGIKPDEQYMASREQEARRKGKEYNPSKDNTLIYTVVGFARDQRIDNLLIPMPAPEDFKDSDSPEADFKAAEAEVKAKRAMMLNPDAPATKISGKRGGKPFGKDPYENIMDRIKEVTGGINAIYTVGGNVADTPMSKRSQASAIAGHVPGEVQKGPENWPRVSGIDRSKIAARTPAAAQPADFNTEFRTIVGKIRPVFPKLIQQAEAIIFKRAQRLIGGDNFDAEEKLLKAKKTLRQFKIAVDTTGELNTAGYENPIVNMIGGALKDATGVGRLNSPEGAEAIRDFNAGGAAKLGPVLDAIRSKLVSIAS